MWEGSQPKGYIDSGGAIFWRSFDDVGTMSGLPRDAVEKGDKSDKTGRYRTPCIWRGSTSR